jgi:hypothetical protein
MYLLECSIAISYHVITKAYAWLIHWSGSCSFRNRAKRVVVSVRERGMHISILNAINAKDKLRVLLR